MATDPYSLLWQQLKSGVEDGQPYLTLPCRGTAIMVSDGPGQTPAGVYFCYTLTGVIPSDHPIIEFYHLCVRNDKHGEELLRRLDTDDSFFEEVCNS